MNSVTSPALIGLALLLGACERAADEPRVPPEQLANRIEALHEGGGGEAEAQKGRLGFVPEAHARLRAGEPSCRLERDGRLIMIARKDGAVARVDGKLRLLRTAGPVGPSGGFWEAQGVSISIGRSAQVAPGAEAPGALWAAGVTVGGDPQRGIQKFNAEWSCRS